MNTAKPDNESPWVKAPVSNLVRYKPSGVYFARAKIGGKLIRQSLKTNVLSIAKLRLRDLLGAEQQSNARQKHIESGKMTFDDALALYKQRVEKNVEIKPRTREYQDEIIVALNKSWADLYSLDIRKITEHDCQNWRSDFAAKYSATRVNGAVSLLRRVFKVAIEAGVRHDNPMLAVRRARVRSKELRLPEAKQFQAFIKEIENGKNRHAQNCANLVRFLAYGGFRKMEASNILWRDCDFNRNKIIVRGSPETGTKNGEIREVPMIPEMREFLGQLRNERPGITPQSPVMVIHKCQGAMTVAAKAVGMSRITHHDLRHLFATRCIESGVDIPTVSRWLGHKDGGALAMRVYGHLRDAHSADMAKKVSFSNSDATNPAQAPEAQVGTA